ncbi:MAG TPA: hypothetical protein PK668_13460 [Myxococcota bacterium]|nr:hypothetical protein [Myxococcota bacterium]HRY94130.1 hypothetical protein [Myxococcota bacterium]HSA24766.1 hypothetical protein [Myxococcota bacterium]
MSAARVSRLALASCLALGLLAPGAGRAEEAPAPEGAECPAPEDAIPRGLQLRASVGPAVWVGAVGPMADVGAVFSFQAAYELWPYLAVEAAWTSALHDTDQPAPPQPGTFTTHAAHGGLRLALPLGRFDLFARGGVGVQWVRPDILVRVEGFDGDLRLGWLGGLGFVWHTPQRHLWLGLEADAQGALGFPGILLTAHALLGWTL